MGTTAIVINALAGTALLVAAVQDRKKAAGALRAAIRSFFGMIPMILIIIILIGLLLGFVPREYIAGIIGGGSEFRGVLISAIAGAVLFIPSLISYPLAASLLENGAAVSSIAAFIASLTMIGIVTLPIEIKELGTRMTVSRNILGFLFALAIGLVMGAVL